jgi:hypothetical protein
MDHQLLCPMAFTCKKDCLLLFVIWQKVYHQQSLLRCIAKEERLKELKVRTSFVFTPQP